jgi:hypothetical protein
VATPVQTLIMKRLLLVGFVAAYPSLLNYHSISKFRRNSMQWTDRRAKILQELLGGMKIIKFFAWELPYLKRISGFRQKEMA